LGFSAPIPTTSPSIAEQANLNYRSGRRHRFHDIWLRALRAIRRGIAIWYDNPRFKLIHQPARLVKPQGYSVLRFSVAQPVQKLIESIEEKLKSAA